jgi:hypothetical protein
MGEGTAPNTEDGSYLNLSRKAIVFELARASYAVGIGTVVTTALVFGVALFAIELPGAAVSGVFAGGLVVLPTVLYLYDRRHSRDFVIADLGHAIVRPAAFLYRIFRSP